MFEKLYQSLFFHWTSHSASLLSDVVTLCLSLAGHSGATHRPSPRTHPPERLVFSLWTDINAAEAHFVSSSNYGGLELLQKVSD